MESKDLLDKLESIDRTINIYTNVTEKLVEAYYGSA